MKLMTKALEARFKKVGKQEKVADPIIIAKFFSPVGRATWYATEYNPKEKVFFGYASLFGDWNDEWGYFSLEELEQVRLPLGLHIERDLYWDEAPMSQVVKK